MNKISNQLSFRRSQPVRSLPVDRSDEQRLRQYLLSRPGIDGDVVHVDRLMRAHNIVNNAKKKLGIL